MPNFYGIRVVLHRAGEQTYRPNHRPGGLVPAGMNEQPTADRDPSHWETGSGFPLPQSHYF